MTRTAPRRCPLVLALALASCAGPTREAESMPVTGVRACDARPSPNERLTCTVVVALDRVAPRLSAREAGPLSIEVRLRDGSVVPLSLDDTQARCTRTPADCSLAIEAFANAVVEYDAALPIDRAAVRAVVRSRAFADAFAAHGQAPLVRPLAADLVVLYVEEPAGDARPLVVSDLASLGLDLAGLDALALANDRTALGDHVPELVAEGPLRTTRVGGHEEASRLLLVDTWQEVAARVEGDLLVAAPLPDLVLYTGSGTEGAAELLRRRAAEIARSEPAGISAAVLRWTPAGFEPFP